MQDGKTIRCDFTRYTHGQLAIIVESMIYTSKDNDSMDKQALLEVMRRLKRQDVLEDDGK